MKNILILLFMCISIIGIAQSKKTAEINFKVYGKCDMCETRIENALDVKGVKLADWDLNTKNCKVIYNTEKISEEQIYKIITEAGHDTDKIRASDEAYDQLHKCCKYERAKD